jgi:hypothetical protein
MKHAYLQIDETTAFCYTDYSEGPATASQPLPTPYDRVCMLAAELRRENEMMKELLSPKHAGELDKLKARLREITEFAKTHPGCGYSCGKLAEKELEDDDWRYRAPGRLMMAAAALLAVSGGMEDLEHAENVALSALKMIEYWDWESEFPEEERE